MTCESFKTSDIFPPPQWQGEFCERGILWTVSHWLCVSYFWKLILLKLLCTVLTMGLRGKVLGGKMCMCMYYHEKNCRKMMAQHLLLCYPTYERLRRLYGPSPVTMQSKLYGSVDNLGQISAFFRDIQLVVWESLKKKKTWWEKVWERIIASY